MDWTTLDAAFLGGGLGGAIPAIVSLVQFGRGKAAALQARRWLDAEIVADAQKLLIGPRPDRLVNKEFVKSARWYRTIQIQADQHTITAADPLPDDLRQALEAINHIGLVCTNLAYQVSSCSQYN